MGRLKNEEENEKPEFKHFSHEHPLVFTNTTSETNQVTCSGCNIRILRGKSYYSCKNAACPFALHSTCFNMPRMIRHPAESSHDLILFFSPSFECKACGDSSGSGFCYHCKICSFNYHSLCISKPPSTSYDFHCHTLKLEFSPPYDGEKGFRCDVCQKRGSDHWLYHCRICEFDAHLSCALSNRPPIQILTPSYPVCEPSERSSQAALIRPKTVTMNIIPQDWSTDFSGSSSLQHRSSPNYINQGSMFANGLQANNPNIGSTSGYGLNQVNFVGQNGVPVLQAANQSVGYAPSNQGVLSGVKGKILAAAASGLGQAISQEIVHAVTNGFGNGLESLDPGDVDTDITSVWFGDSDNY